jgi:thymidylate synthase
VRDETIEAATVGEAWLAVAERILEQGTASHYDGLPILEIDQVALHIARASSTDPIVERLGDPERLAWMHANFTDHARVAALGDARSYAARLYDYAGSGRDQIRWVVERLRADPTSRSATITTFEPLLDTAYIPCVSLLDFWIRDEQVELVVYAHSIDFGAKGYGNLVELAFLQEHVARELARDPGRLVFLVKSAHVYQSEFDYMRKVLDEAN